MGGFYVPSQPLSVYQAIEWLCSETAVHNQVVAVGRIREMVDKGKADDVVKLGIVSRLSELLERAGSNFLQVSSVAEKFEQRHETVFALKGEIIWTLSNIAAGKSSHTKLVMTKFWFKLMSLLSSPVHPCEFKIDIVWTFANIAGDSEFCRDFLIEKGLLGIILQVMNETNCLELLQKSLWFLVNIFRHPDPLVSTSVVSACVARLKSYLNHANTEVIRGSCNALKNISKGSEEHVDVLIEADCCPSLVQLLGSVQNSK